MHSGLTNREALSDAVPYSAAQQPARQRLVAIAPRAVPVVGLPRACYRVAKGIGDWRRRVPACRAARRRQVPAYAPVLVFHTRAGYLLVQRTTVAVVYPSFRKAKPFLRLITMRVLYRIICDEYKRCKPRSQHQPKTEPFSASPLSSC